MDHRRVPRGWAAWFLVLAAALPDALIVRFGWKVLTGSADESFGLGDRSLTGVEVLGNRWTILWMIPSVPILPLMGLLPLVVLVVLVLADRPRSLVPTGVGRVAAVLVAAVTALLGLTGSVAVGAQVLGLLPALGWGGYTGSQLEAWAPTAAVVFTTTVVAAAVVVVLSSRERGRGDIAGDAEEDVVDDVDLATGLAGEPEEDTRVRALPPVAVAADPAEIRPPAPPSLPVPADLDLYRR
jgi:hypothetical protein